MGHCSMTGCIICTTNRPSVCGDAGSVPVYGYSISWSFSLSHSLSDLLPFKWRQKSSKIIIFDTWTMITLATRDYLSSHYSTYGTQCLIIIGVFSSNCTICIKKYFQTKLGFKSSLDYWAVPVFFRGVFSSWLSNEIYQ